MMIPVDTRTLVEKLPKLPLNCPNGSCGVLWKGLAQPDTLNQVINGLRALSKADLKVSLEIGEELEAAGTEKAPRAKEVSSNAA
jgi:hypothetical protein